MALGAALGADSFSISVGIGLGGVRLRRAGKLALLFGGAQGGLLFAGGRLAALIHWLLDTAMVEGTPLARIVPHLDFATLHGALHAFLSVCGAAILVYVGGGLICGYFRHNQNAHPVFYRGRWALAMLALSVSIDAFSAGLGLGMLEHVNLPVVAGEVTLVAGTLAFIGLRGGRNIGRLIGRRAELAGGLILFALAGHMAWQVCMGS